MFLTYGSSFATKWTERVWGCFVQYIIFIECLFCQKKILVPLLLAFMKMNRVVKRFVDPVPPTPSTVLNFCKSNGSYCIMYTDHSILFCLFSVRVCSGFRFFIRTHDCVTIYNYTLCTCRWVVWPKTYWNKRCSLWEV